jgi:hypothetical protein
MADRVLFISWGEPVRGMEERAIEVFNDALGILGRMQQDGRIERFDVQLLRPSADIGGYMSIFGTAEQIHALREDEEFMRNTIDATLSVERMRHLEGFANEGVATQMGMYQEAMGRMQARA